MLGGSALAASPASANTAAVQGALQVIQTTTGPAVAGLPLTYSISVTNISSGLAGGVMLGDTLPSGFLPTSLLGPGGNPDLCTRTKSGAFSCSMGDLAPAATATLTFTGPVPLNLGALTNQAVAQACLGLATAQTAAGCTNMGGMYPTTTASMTVPVSSTALAQAPATVPGAPTTVAGRAGNAQAMVWWNPPASDGNSPITSYTVTSNPPGATATVAAPGTAVILTGLTNYTPYTFTVTATNAVGTSTVSAPSGVITPVAGATVPAAPASVTAAGGNGQATVSWTAPASNGGSAITSYTVTSSPAGAIQTVAAPATSATVTGLTNGTAYTFTVTATNVAGTGTPSLASNAVTPVAPPAVATWPRASLAGLTTAQVGTSSIVTQAGPITAATTGVPVTISWGCSRDPLVSGISNCDHYALQQSVNGGQFTNVSLPTATATSVTLNLLPSPINKTPAGTSYVFRVQAFDAAGTAGPFAQAAAFTVPDVDNSFSSSFNGSWSGVNLSTAFGGSVHESTTAGASAGPANAAPATSLAWVSTMGPDRGQAQVKVDGQVVATVDLYAPVQQASQVVWALNGLAPGVNHSIQIVASGTKNPAASAAKVDYDAIFSLR